MPSKVKDVVVEDEEPAPHVDPPQGTDFYRYLATPVVTYEGGYTTWPPPPVEVEDKDDDKKGKKDAKGGKGKKGVVEEEVPEVVDPPRLVKSGEGTYSDGIIHCSGSWDQDSLHGKATFQFPSGCIYEGEWDHGIFQGMGKYSWPDGSWYEGGWYQNKFHGMGKYFNQNLDRMYEGQYYNGAGPGFYIQA